MPRVSVFSTGSPDFLIDIVADGLVRLLGREGVHIRYNRTTAPESKFDHLFEAFGHANGFGYHDADLLVASVRCPVGEIRDWSSRTGRPVAVLDGEDDPTVRDDFLALARGYFKREYLHGLSYAPRVFPLPMAAIPEPLPAPVRRTTPAFYMGRDNSRIREEVRQALHGMGFATSQETLSKARYNEELSRSVAGVSAKGVGWDTYRYWEVPYFGAALVSQRLRLVVPGDFAEDREAVFFSCADEMRAKLSALLSDPGRTSDLAEAGRRASRERHLSTNRAHTVLSRVGL
jgi:Glycosyl transferases group 1